MRERQRRFVEAFFKGKLDRVQSMREAGYEGSEQTLASDACRLLKNAKVKAYLEELRAERAERLKVTADKVVRDLRLVKRRCLQAVEVRDAQGNPTGYWKFDSRGALKALELMGKHIGMFTEVVKLSGLEPLTIRTSREDIVISPKEKTK